LEGFPFPKPQRKIIQLQLEDTWALSLKKLKWFPPCSSHSLHRNFFKEKRNNLRLEIGGYVMIIWRKDGGFYSWTSLELGEGKDADPFVRS
jgi:hypothetical protein